MTLKEAQKKWDDAIQLKVKHHVPNAVSEEYLRKFVQGYYKEPVGFLSIKIGKRTSSIIFSRLAGKEEQRQLSIIPGSKVKMIGAEGELENLKEKVFTVTHGPVRMCDELVVWLDGYSGAYACEYLEIIE